MAKRIPPTEAWLLPFLRILSDEKPHKRGEILNTIADQMGLTEAQRQERFDLKGNFVIVNRIAWCDVEFCKAKFAIKDDSNKDNLQHSFHITPLGLKELKTNSDKITSAYLRTFWKV
jgi:restriction endonuclease Mrr